MQKSGVVRLSQDMSCSCYFCDRRVCATRPDPREPDQSLGVCWKHAAGLPIGIRLACQTIH